MTATPPSGPKFRRRAEARPDEVLDAALELFIEKGFSATKVEEIARRAGLSKGAVYLYFPSKDALVEGLVRRAVVPIAANAIANAAIFRGHPRLLISAVLKMVAARLADGKLLAIPRLIVREAVAFPQIAEIYRREVLDHILPVIQNILSAGIANGYLRPVDPELTIRSIIGPIMAHMVLSEVFGLRPADGLAIDRLIDNHLTILFDGLSLPPAEGGRND